MGQLEGKLTVMMILFAILAFAPTAAAESVRVDVDGDRIEDPVSATTMDDGSLLVGALLSSKENSYTAISFPNVFMSEPHIRAKGNVDGVPGAELFVRTAHISTYDSISVVTVSGARLIRAGIFPVNSSLSDGYAMGIKCGRVKGKPGVFSFSFSRGASGKWEGLTKRFVWKRGRLKRVGRVRLANVRTPPMSRTSLGCARSKTPVLGSPDNGVFAGLGVARPGSFSSAAGFESFWGVEWKRWGRKKAIGRGQFDSGGDEGARPVRLVALGLGLHRECGDRLAYRRLRVKVAGSRASTVRIC